MIFCAAASRKAGGRFAGCHASGKAAGDRLSRWKARRVFLVYGRRINVTVQPNREGSQLVITVILAILSGLSAVYGIITFLYSGIHTVWLWAGLTAFFGALTWGNHYYLLHKKTVPM